MDKSTAAHFAASVGALNCIQALCSYGADLTIQNKRQNSLLHCSGMYGHAKCCKFLAQRGCNPMVKNLDKKTPRLVAKDFGKKLAMKELRKAERLWNKYNGENPIENPVKNWQIKLYDWIYDCERQDGIRQNLNYKAALVELPNVS